MEKKEELKDFKFIEELIPSIDLDDAEIIVGMINGYQGQDINDKQVFKNLDHLIEIAEKAGAMPWLENHLGY